MTNKELETIEQLTEVAIRMAELKAENKILKEINEKLMQSYVSNHSSEFWDGFNFACDLLEDLGYAKSSTHPYNISDCLKAKMNRLPKNKVRKNDQ